MSDQKARTGSRVLCLDGGGMRGLSMILLLKELMLQVRIQSKLNYTPEPRNCFDYICGTSSGGLIAILLGRLGKTLQESEDAFRNLGTEIFAEGNVSRTVNLMFRGSRHSSDRLREVVVDLAKEQDMFDKDLARKNHVPVAVIAVSKMTKSPNVFTTYGIRAEVEPVSIVDACRATSAATMLFEPAEVNGITYVDGGFGQNNPSKLILSELESHESPFPRMVDAVKELGCFISLGTGRSTHIYDQPSLTEHLKVNGVKTIEDAVSLLKAIALECHDTHLEVRARFARENALERYFRFDVDRGLESVMLNEAHIRALEQITSTTKAYFIEQKTNFIACAQKITPQINDTPKKIGSRLPLNPNVFYSLGANTIRVLYQPFDIDAEGLRPEEMAQHYPGIGIHGRSVQSWDCRISDGFFRVSKMPEDSDSAFINSINCANKITGYAIDLRDCIVSVAVRMQRPSYQESGAGLIVRYRGPVTDGDKYHNGTGLCFVKEPGRCCTIYRLDGVHHDRKASFPLPSAGLHDQDPFDTLKIICRGDRIVFMVNDCLTAEMEDKALEDIYPKLAIYAFGRGAYDFDDFQLWMTEKDWLGSSLGESGRREVEQAD